MPRLRNPPSRFLAALDVPLVLAIHLGVRLVGLARIRRILRRIPLGKAPPPTDSALIVEHTRLRLRLVKMRLPWCGNCLSRSLAIWLLLRRHGVDSALRIGAMMKDGGLKAHAWVEFEGKPVNAGPKVVQRFISFDEDFATDAEWTR
ncbi:lasso peptide biosynthesis B2 protein [Gymnodinialimonas sp.]